MAMEINRAERAGRQGGFILKVAMVVACLCIAFIVLASVAKSVIPAATSGEGGASRAPVLPSETGRSNPLLKFLDETPSSSYDSYGSSQVDVPAGQRSAYAGRVTLGSGNAGYTAQPFEEYVTIRNVGNGPVNITGWTLANGRGIRPIQTSQNDYLYPVADTATIGEGTEFLDPSGSFRVGPIVLKPNDNAIVTTGRPFSQFPFSITTSFRENICDGYLRNYPFEPALSYSCPLPANDPMVGTVTDQCYDYMESLSRCEDPYKYDKAGYDAQTAQCRSFMDARLSYPSCVARSKGLPSFSVNQWRVFLGKGKELWASRRELITLYDSQGLIVDQISY